MRSISVSHSPVLRDVILGILKVCVYEAWKTPDIKPYGYAKACKAAIARYTNNNNEAFLNQVENSTLFSVANGIANYIVEFDLGRNKKENLNERVRSLFITPDAFEAFLNSYCEDYGGSLKGWISGKPTSVQKSLEAATFFTSLMVLDADKDLIREYLEMALGCFGIVDVEMIVWDTLIESLTDADADVDPNEYSKALTLLGIINYVLLSSCGDDNSSCESKFSRFYQYFSSQYENEILAEKALAVAADSWLNDIRHFEPRSINISDVRPQDFYVHPCFLDDKDPLKYLSHSDTSQRFVVQAKTGMGKTMLLRTLALCLQQSEQSKKENAGLIEQLRKAYELPNDSYVLFIPAGMFSFCFSAVKYRNWTLDIVELFFNCIFKLSAAYNFYSGSNPQRYSISPETREYSQYEVTKALKVRLQYLAKHGRLVLLADSFDEIVSGEMRTAYLKALCKFCQEYCQYPEDNCTGAHVLVTSREMSPDTMDSLARALLVDYTKCKCQIEPLSDEQQRKLIANWCRYLKEDVTEVEAMISGIENNHFCQEFASNPYMLSVLCAKRGIAYDKVTQDFINTLVTKIRTSYRIKDEFINDILQGQNLNIVLQNTALKTIETNSSHFSARDLEKQFRPFIDDDELSPDQLAQVLQQLHEIFVTAVGLIVPADGDDTAYQFLNEQIRFQLAAKGIRRELREYEGRSVVYRNILNSQDNVESYVGLLIPLLSDLGYNEDPALSEMLVFDLALHESDNDREFVLLRAMVDIILGRYGFNIATPNTVSSGDRGRAIRRTQTMLILRVFSSRFFRPSTAEKTFIRHSSAYQYAEHLLNEEQIALLK